MGKKTFVRILIFVLIAILLVAQFAIFIPVIRTKAQEFAVVSAHDVITSSGNSVDVGVSISQPSNLVSGAFTLSYSSSKLEFVEAKAGEVLPEALVVTNAKSGKLQVSFASSEKAQSEGDIVVLTFKTKSSLSDQEIPLTCKTLYLEDADGNEIAHNVENGSITISDMVIGDVDSNGKVEKADAQLLLKYLTGKQDLSNFQIKSADFDSDGKVTSTDARKILEKVTPKPQEVKPEKPQTSTTTTNTNTSTSTNTTTDTKVGVVVNTGGEGLSVRIGPGTNFTKLGTMPEGCEIVIYEKTDNNWYKVKGVSKVDGSTLEGYSSGEYIRIG